MGLCTAYNRYRFYAGACDDQADQKKQAETYFAQIVLEIFDFLLVTLYFSFQLTIVILQAVDQMTHFTVDWPRLLIGCQVLFQLSMQGLVVVTHLNFKHTWLEPSGATGQHKQTQIVSFGKQRKTRQMYYESGYKEM